VNRVRIFIVAVLALVCGFFFTSNANAAAPSDEPYPPGDCSTLTISATVANIGDTLHITGANFNAGDELDIVLHSDPVVVGHVTVDADGAFEFDFVVPDLEAGNHTITVEGSTNEVCPVDPLEIVINGVGPTEPGGNANTGVDSLTAILVAGALIGAGLLLATSGRRRGHSGRHGA